jgi:gas vesicle protein
MSTAKVMTGFLLGAAAGIAAGYFLNSDKKDELMDEIKDKAQRLKDKSQELKGRLKEKMSHAEGELEKATR